MRKKKNLVTAALVSPTAAPPPQTEAAEIAEKDHETIHTLENIMAQTIDPANPLTPGQLHDVMEMMLTDMHLRKVTGEFWVATANEIMVTAKAAVEVNLLATLLKKLPDLTEQNKKTMESMLDLCVKETNDLRKTLLPKVNLLTSMPCPDVKLH